MRVLALVSFGALVAAGLAARLSIPAASPPVAPIDSSLQAVACPSPGQCISVGFTGSKYTVLVPLAALLEDGAWTVRPRQPPSQRGDMFPSAVACRSRTSCIAAGVREVPAPYFGAPSAGDRPFIQTWDGKTWREHPGVVPPGTADAELRGIACASSTCMAVGEYAKRLHEDRALAESWDGSSWKLHLPPTIVSRGEAAESVLSDVACVSPTSCIAVGQFRLELIGGLLPVVGPLIERWDGRAWHAERSANPGSDDAELYGVSCHSPERCVAVGSRLLRSRTFGTLAEAWDGTAWHVLETPDPPRSTNARLLDVTCPRSDRCIAVGSSTSSGGRQPLIEAWDGRRWRVEPIAVPASFSSSTLDSIDCAAPASCHAVGTYQERAPILHSFSAELIDGDWMVRPIRGT